MLYNQGKTWSAPQCLRKTKKRAPRVFLKATFFSTKDTKEGTKGTKLDVDKALICVD